MAQLTLTVTGAGTYTVSIKKTGDNTERVVSVNSSTVNFTADVGTFQYTITVTAGNCTPESQNFTLECLQQGGAETPSPEYQATIPNIFLIVPKETSVDQFSPEKFSNLEIPLSNDSYLNQDTPNWLVSLETYPTLFSNKNVSPYDKGIYSARSLSYTECSEIWVPSCSVPESSFISSFPYNKRFGVGILSDMVSNSFITDSPTETVYNYGRSLAGSFGMGDSVNGRKRIAINSLDVETGTEDGGTEGKARGMGSLLKGMGDAIQGYVYPLYVISLFTYGHACLGRYPNLDGSFNDIIPSDETPGVNYAISGIWKNPFSLNGETVYLKDCKNVRETEETSHYAEDSFEQGYAIKDQSGTNVLRITNHFGTTNDITGASGYNVAHVLSKGISITETGVAYAKSQNRDYIIMFKFICDRGSGYIWTDTKEYHDTIGQGFSFHLPRNISFASVMFSFLSGTKGLHIWDFPRNGLNLDTYNGVFGALQYIHQKFNINGNQVSLADIRNNLIFNTWNTEQSYDGGNSYVKHKAIDWKNSMNYIPLRTAYTNDGYVVVFASRPYNVEPLSCKWKVTIGSTVHTGDITSSDWKSCYPENPDRKDFVFKIIKYNGNI